MSSYCEVLLEDEPEHFLPSVLDEVQALQRQAQADPDPGYQHLATRCAWFAGNIEAGRGAADPLAKDRALAWYQQALDIIVGSTNFITLVERCIRADMERLGNQLGSS